MATQRQIPRVSGLDPQITRILEPIKNALEQLTAGPARAVRLSDLGSGLTFAKGKVQTTGGATTTTTADVSSVTALQQQLTALIASEQQFQSIINQQIDTLTLLVTSTNGGATFQLDVNGYVTGYLGQGGSGELNVHADNFGIVRPVITFPPSTALSLGDFVIPSATGNVTGLIYEVTTAGTTDAVEPDWSTADTPSDTIASGTVTFTARAVDVVEPFIVGDVGGVETIGIDGATVVDATVPYRAIEDASALSVLGRALNSSGVLADIQAGSDFQVLRRSGTAIAFGAIDLSQAAAVTNRLAFANIAQITGQAILGVSTAGAGNLAAINAGTDDRILRQTAGALNFGQLTAGMFPAAVVPDAALSDRVLLLDGDDYLVIVLEDYADDTAADAGGVPTNGLYRTGSDVKVNQL